MNNKDSLDSEVKRAAFHALSQQRIKRNAQVGQMASAFAGAAEELPGVQTLQSALLSGLAGSQKREAERLAARLGTESPQARKAAARASAYADFVEEAAAKVELIGRAVQTYQSDARFAGYVFHPDGSPAADHVLQLDVRDSTRRLEYSRKASTADDGYFEIDLELPDTTGYEQKPDGPAKAQPATNRIKANAAVAGDDPDTAAMPAWQSTLLHWVENLNTSKSGASDAANASSASGVSSAADAGAAAASAPKPGASTDTGSGNTETLNSRVRIYDKAGKLVYQDPLPPRLDGQGSEFRVYALEGK